jgi:hypothetical protein
VRDGNSVVPAVPSRQRWCGFMWSENREDSVKDLSGSLTEEMAHLTLLGRQTGALC